MLILKGSGRWIKDEFTNTEHSPSRNTIAFAFYHVLQAWDPYRNQKRTGRLIRRRCLIFVMGNSDKACVTITMTSVGQAQAFMS
jgi:hypothetical protein